LGALVNEGAVEGLCEEAGLVLAEVELGVAKGDEDGVGDAVEHAGFDGGISGDVEGEHGDEEGLGLGDLVEAGDGQFVGAEAEGEAGDGDGVAFSAAEIRSGDMEAHEELSVLAAVDAGAPAW
jgi:hypothetical protein